MGYINEQDIYSVAEYMHVDLSDEDVFYIMERYDDYAASGLLWVEVLEQMVYELKESS